MIRAFDLLDLPTLYSYRSQGMYLDCALELTWGQALIPATALLGPLLPTAGIATMLATDQEGLNERPIIAQVHHRPGAHYARLVFLAPKSALHSPALSFLLEHFVKEIGRRGAHYLIAEVDEGSELFETLRRNHFAIYTRQQLWKLEPSSAPTGWNPQGSGWGPATEDDLFAIRQLHSVLVPGLVEQIEPLPEKPHHCWVYRASGEILAWVEMKHGPLGIWMQPFVRSNAKDVSSWLAELLNRIPLRLGRPLFICTRSYQAWLNSALEDIGAEPGPRQAAMVKRLIISQPVRQKYKFPALENGHPEISTPITHSTTLTARATSHLIPSAKHDG